LSTSIDQKFVLQKFITNPTKNSKHESRQLLNATLIFHSKEFNFEKNSRGIALENNRIKPYKVAF